MDLIDTLSISASGLTAQRVRLQTVASNMANARTTRTAEGGPYQRRMPVFEAETEAFGGMLEKNLARVNVSEIKADDSDPIRVFDPGHPDADEFGYVDYPNVNVLEEMVDLMTTARSYESNTNVVKATQDMASTALEIGRL
jgi:flagellar basal-body rod protein FlgC